MVKFELNIQILTPPWQVQLQYSIKHYVVMLVMDLQ
jgi:hypothetical protein